jgi:hypothetical protein
MKSKITDVLLDHIGQASDQSHEHTTTTTTHGTIHKSCNRKQNVATGSTSTVFFGLRHKNETAKNMKQNKDCN